MRDCLAELTCVLGHGLEMTEPTTGGVIHWVWALNYRKEAEFKWAFIIHSFIHSAFNCECEQLLQVSASTSPSVIYGSLEL